MQEAKAPEALGKQAPTRSPDVATPHAVLAAAEVSAMPPSIRVEACSDEPFGVAKIILEFPEGKGPQWYPDRLVRFDQQVPRALYPAFHVRYGFDDGAEPWKMQELTGYFLFQGNARFPVRVMADRAYEAQVQPLTDPDRHSNLIDAWWREYRTRRPVFVEDYSEPRLVHNYLTSMLKRRLGIDDSDGSGGLAAANVLVSVFRSLLSPVFPTRPAADRGSAQGSSRSSLAAQIARGRMDRDLDRLLGFLLGTESVRIALQTERMLADIGGAEPADQAIPLPAAPQTVPLPEYPTPAELEAIARHVPEECFYVRSRSAEKYLWFRNLLVSWGGSIEDLIAMQSLDHAIRPKLERQLAIPCTASFCRELDAVITDMALIGTDLFFRDGPALGVLFEARDSLTLSGLIRRERLAVWNASPDAVEREIELGSGKALLLSTPDNAVRSFYVVDGSYHLVTSSSYIARRFLEAGRGDRSLASLKEFCHARHVVPLARQDTVFIYLSDPFFRNLIGPQYRIEMARRLRALGDLQLVDMAKLAAKAEGLAAATLPELIRSGLLPPNFLDRSDSSRPVMQQEMVLDSLRGAAGTFLPIPDVPVTKATASEVRSYRELMEYYRSQWRRMDPVTVGISRRPVGHGGRQRVVLDVHITPYARENYEQVFQMLDAPSRERLAPVKGDIFSIEARLRNSGPAARWFPVNHSVVSAGFRDFQPPLAIEDGQVKTVPLGVRGLIGGDYPVYVSMRPMSPSVDLLRLGGHTAQADGQGYSQSTTSPLALFRWRRLWNPDCVAWAPGREILAEVTPQLAAQPAEREAQIRFRMGDLMEARLAPVVQAISYTHARRISAINARFLDEIAQQFALRPDRARQAAVRLLGGKVVCPLGGQYVLDDRAGRGRWTGTAWPEASLYQETAVPGDYRFSFLDWLRGAEFELTLDRWSLEAHVELTVKPQDGGT